MWPCTQPIRELGAGSACPLEQGWRKLRSAKTSAAKGKRPARERSVLDPQEVRSRIGLQAQPTRWNKANENFDLQKRAQPKASDLRESVQSRPAGGPFAKWVQAQPARLNKANENFDLQKRAQPKASDLRESVQSRPAGGSVRELGAGSACLGWRGRR